MVLGESFNFQRDSRRRRNRWRDQKSATNEDDNLLGKWNAVKRRYNNSTCPLFLSNFYTMSFTSAIAGPSRLPYRAITAQSAGAVRYYASAESSSEAAESTDRDSAGSAPDVSANFYGAEKKGRGRIRGMTYTLWKRTVGRDMEHPQPGKKAQWLGGDVVSPAMSTATQANLPALSYEPFV